jgi:hypothetical protein
MAPMIFMALHRHSFGACPITASRRGPDADAHDDPCWNWCCADWKCPHEPRGRALTIGAVVLVWCWPPAMAGCWQRGPGATPPPRGRRQAPAAIRPGTHRRGAATQANWRERSVLSGSLQSQCNSALVKAKVAAELKSNSNGARGRPRAAPAS